MEVVDTKKLETAIIYLQRIAEGHNPVNNMPMDEDSVLDNPNVKRCMLFIKEVMEEVKNNAGYIGRKPKAGRDDTKLDYPLEKLDAFKYEEDKTITKIVKQLNSLVDTTVYKKIVYNQITDWLKENGYLETKRDDYLGKNTTVPTEDGRAIGISSEFFNNPQGRSYIRVSYDQKAQEFIVKKMDKILQSGRRAALDTTTE